MSQREKRVPVYATIPESLNDALDELAVDMKTDPQGVLNDLLELMLDDGAMGAREVLDVMPRGCKLAVAS